MKKSILQTALALGITFQFLPLACLGISIANFSPVSGPSGTEVTINGSGFDSPTAPIVFFGGIKAKLTATTNTYIKAIVPAGVTTGLITVVSNGLSATSLRAFQVINVCKTARLGDRIDLSVGDPAGALDIGDFNHDGLADIVTVMDYEIDSIMILLGNGNGLFKAGMHYAVDQHPTSVTIADFNADGHLDVAVANSFGSLNTGYEYENTISVLLGDGQGKFAPQKEFATAYHVNTVVAGDFNGDGKQDLAGSNGPSQSVSVLLGAGDGTFAWKVDYPVGGFPTDMVKGDFDGDGILDLVTANNDANTISVLRGNGNGTFAAKVNYATGPLCNKVKMGDFNSDGKSDLATLNGGDSTMSILIANGSGSFNAPIQIRTRPGQTSFRVGDFDADGTQDIAIFCDYLHLILLYRGNGTGNFTLYDTYKMDALGHELAVGDFNRDGMEDIAVTKSRDDFKGTLSLFLGQCVPKITKMTPMSGPVGTVVTLQATALNKAPGQHSVSFDGLKADIVAATDSNVSFQVPAGASLSRASLFSNGRYATFPIPFDVTNSPCQSILSIKAEYETDALLGSIVTADLNKDGKLDLAVTEDYKSILLIFMGKGDGTFESPKELSCLDSPRIVQVGDVNSDGHLDLIAFYRYTNSTIFYGNGTGDFPTQQLIPSNAAISSACMGDFTEDGKLEVAFTALSSLVILSSTDTGRVRLTNELSVNQVSTSYASVTADFNKDGREDLATLAANSPVIYVYLNSGRGKMVKSGEFPTDQVVVRDNMTKVLTVGDFNSDGNQDLATLCSNSKQSISILLGDGKGQFGAKNTFAITEQPFAMVPGDINGDGKLDLIVNNYQNRVLVLYGDGTGTFPSQARYNARTSLNNLTIGDFNADGRQDVATTNGVSVTVFLNSCDLSTDLGEIQTSRITVYPNPSKEHFRLDLGQLYASVQIQITDVAGAPLGNYQLKQTQSIEVQINARPGIYFLHIRADGQNFIKKMMKEE